MNQDDDARSAAIETLFGLLVVIFAGGLAIAGLLLLGGGCGGAAPTIIRGTLGGLYGACQTVESDDKTWRQICDGVEQALPAINALGAGPAELPDDVAARRVTITIEDE